MSPDLRRRIAFILGALLIYCFGSYILIPGLERGVWELFFRPQDSNILFGMFSRGGIHQLATLVPDRMPAQDRREPAPPGDQNP